MITIFAVVLAALAAVLVGLMTGSGTCPPWQGDDALIEYDVDVTQ